MNLTLAINQETARLLVSLGKNWLPWDESDSCGESVVLQFAQDCGAGVFAV